MDSPLPFYRTNYHSVSAAVPRLIYALGPVRLAIRQVGCVGIIQGPVSVATEAIATETVAPLQPTTRGR